MVRPLRSLTNSASRLVRRSIASLALLAACSSPAEESDPEYVGMLVDSLPEPVVVVAAGTLESESVDSLHSIWHVRTPEGAEMLWLQRRHGLTTRGRASWEIRAVERLPALRPGDHVAFHTCELEGRPDQAVAAVLAEEEWKEMFTNVRAAWRADPAAGRFEPIDPSRVRCLNEGWGV